MASFDELNNLATDDDELVRKKIREYFEEMDLDKKEVEKRIGFALDLEIVFRNLFLLMIGADMMDSLENQVEPLKQYAYEGYIDAMVKNGYSNDEDYQGFGYIEQYAKQRCSEIVDTAVLHRVDEYYSSLEHSISIAEDECNAVANYYDEQMAIAQGYTAKTWVTFRDNRVRHSHQLVDGETISIFKPFNVGGYQAMFPMDSSLGLPMKERANCRCIVEYSK